MSRSRSCRRSSTSRATSATRPPASRSSRSPCTSRSGPLPSDWSAGRSAATWPGGSAGGCRCCCPARYCSPPAPCGCPGTRRGRSSWRSASCGDSASGSTSAPTPTCSSTGPRQPAGRQRRLNAIFGSFGSSLGIALFTAVMAAHPLKLRPTWAVTRSPDRARRVHRQRLRPVLHRGRRRAGPIALILTLSCAAGEHPPAAAPPSRLPTPRRVGR